MVPGGGSRGSTGAGRRTGSGVAVGAVVWRWGALSRKSASRASSWARRRARSDRSPSAKACIRQAMRLTSQVRLLAWVASPNSSAKRCRSWPTLRRSSAATSLTLLSSTGFSFVGFRRRSTRVDSEPRFAEKRKAIRDKKERFFERKGGQEMAVPVVESAAGRDLEWPVLLRGSYGRESQPSLRDTRSTLSHAGICPGSKNRFFRADDGPGHVNASGESVRGPLVRVPGGLRAVDRHSFRSVRRLYR